MEKLVERAGKAEAEIEKLYAEFERLQKLQPEEGATPEELVRFVNAWMENLLSGIYDIASFKYLNSRPAFNLCKE